MTLDGTAGLNFAIARKPRPDRINSDGLQLLPSYRLGLDGRIWLGYSRTSLVLGLAVIQDRAVVNGYTKQSSNLLFNEPTPFRSRVGTLDINETHLRGHFGVRIDWEKVSLLSSISVSGFIAGGQRFDFVQTTTGFSDPFDPRGAAIILEAPLVSTGSVDYPTEELRQNTYGALLLGLGYHFSSRLTVWLELESGIQLGNSFSPEGEYKQYNARLGLAAGYRLAGR